ncbi:MAG: amidohydrolase family protein [bacterium]
MASQRLARVGKALRLRVGAAYLGGGKWAENAVLEFCEGRIAGLHPDCTTQPGEADFSRTLALPGLVNAHIHLEFSHFRLARPTTFTGWLISFVQFRESCTEQDWLRGSREGIEEVLASGTTFVGNHVTFAWPLEPVARCGLRAIQFAEALGLAPLRLDQDRKKIEKYEAEIPRLGGRVDLGYAPHTPYSLESRFLCEMVSRARRAKTRISIHVSESPEEIEFMQRGSGIMGDLFRRWEFVPSNWKPPGKSPVAYLADLGVLGPDVAAIHCNYLSDDDIEMLRRTGTSVIFCPRSHEYFGHKNHPLRRLRAAGVVACLATDSRASNDALDMRSEMRRVRELFPELMPTEIWELATTQAAKAIGRAGWLGVLRPGAAADVALFRDPGAMPADRLEALLDNSAAPCVATFVAGEQLWPGAGTP